MQRTVWRLAAGLGMSAVPMLIVGCWTSQVNILSLEMDRLEKEKLILRMVTDLDLGSSEFKDCIIRLDYFPYDSSDPKRGVKDDLGDGPARELPINDDLCRRQFEIQDAGATFSEFFNRDREGRLGGITSRAGRTADEHCYTIAIPLKQDTKEVAYSDPYLGGRFISNVYDLRNSKKIVLWGRLIGPVPYAFVGYRGFESPLYRLEVSLNR